MQTDAERGKSSRQNSEDANEAFVASVGYECEQRENDYDSNASKGRRQEKRGSAASQATHDLGKLLRPEQPLKLGKVHPCDLAARYWLLCWLRRRLLRLSLWLALGIRGRKLLEGKRLGSGRVYLR
jgi:hypothetical protein